MVAVPQGELTEQFLCPQVPALALEFTWILLLGPPKICIVGVPWMFSAACLGVACGLLLSRTRIGMGAADSDTPHPATAPILCFVMPFRRPAKKVGILSVTVTFIKGTGAIAAVGEVTPGGCRGIVPGAQTKGP